MTWRPDSHTALLLLLLGVAGIGLFRLHLIDAGISRVLSRRLELPSMQTAESTVTNTAGIAITIKTPRNEGESTVDWIARHLDAVNAAKDS